MTEPYLLSARPACDAMQLAHLPNSCLEGELIGGGGRKSTERPPLTRQPFFPEPWRLFHEP